MKLCIWFFVKAFLCVEFKKIPNEYGKIVSEVQSVYCLHFMEKKDYLFFYFFFSQLQHDCVTLSSFVPRNLSKLLITTPVTIINLFRGWIISARSSDKCCRWWSPEGATIKRAEPPRNDSEINSGTGNIVATPCRKSVHLSNACDSTDANAPFF